MTVQVPGNQYPPHPDVTLVWAQASNGVIGHEGDMPWHVPEDLRHFQQVTAGKAVVMGRRTWESLPVAVRPLRGRVNVVLTRDVAFMERLRSEHPDVLVCGSLADALEAVADMSVAVIGGAGVFAEALPFATCVELTRLDVSPVGDTFAPVFESLEVSSGAVWVLLEDVYNEGWDVSVSGVRFRFERWVRSAL